MTDFARIYPRRYTGTTGRAIRGELEAMVVMDFVIITAHRNMIGLYYLPIAYIMADTGLPFEGASKGLRRLVEVGFCRYDEVSEVIWVINMARDQIAPELKPADNRCKNVQDIYDSVPENAFLSDFFEYYAPKFHMTRCRNGGREVRGLLPPHQAPSKALTHPLRSQDQDQDQDQHQDQDQRAADIIGREGLGNALTAAGCPMPIATWDALDPYLPCTRAQVVEAVRRTKVGCEGETPRNYVLKVLKGLKDKSWSPESVAKPAVPNGNDSNWGYHPGSDFTGITSGPVNLDE